MDLPKNQLLMEREKRLTCGNRCPKNVISQYFLLVSTIFSILNFYSLNVDIGAMQIAIQEIVLTQSHVKRSKKFIANARIVK